MLTRLFFCFLAQHNRRTHFHGYNVHEITSGAHHVHFFHTKTCLFLFLCRNNTTTVASLHLQQLRTEHFLSLLHRKIVKGYMVHVYTNHTEMRKDALRTFHDGVIIIEKRVVFKLKEKRNTFLYCYYRHSFFPKQR